MVKNGGTTPKKKTKKQKPTGPTTKKSPKISAPSSPTKPSPQPSSDEKQKSPKFSPKTPESPIPSTKKSGTTTTTDTNTGESSFKMKYSNKTPGVSKTPDFVKSPPPDKPKKRDLRDRRQDKDFVKSPREPKILSLKSPDVQSSSPRQKPSFKEVKPPPISDEIEYFESHIVKSEKETDSTEKSTYLFMKPRKKSKRYKQVLVTNIVLTIIVLALSAIAGYLIHSFVFHYDTSVVPTASSLNILANLCYKYKNDSKMVSSCLYYKHKLSTTCKSDYCSYVSLLVKNQRNPYGKDRHIRIEPYEKYSVEINVPEFTPCENDAWCKNGTCESINNQLFDDFNDFTHFEPVDGNWKLICKSGELYCLDVPFLEVKENILNCSKNWCLESGDFMPSESVEFTFRTCTNPVPQYGGKLCWDEKELVVNDAVVALRICDKCEIRQSEYNFDNCEFNNTAGFECVATCGSKNISLPNSYNCTRADGKVGYCFFGICAEFLNSTCIV